MVQLSGTLHQVDERRCLQRYAGDQLTDGSVGLLSQVMGQDLQPKARDHFKVHGTNPHTATTGEEGDISNVSTYRWYEWCYYREHTNRFPFNQEVLGWVLGPAQGEVNEMAQWILKANGNVVPQHSHRPLQVAKINSPMAAKKHKWFDSLIERTWGTSMVPPKQNTGKAKEENFKIYEDDDENGHHIPDIEDSVDSSRGLLNQLLAYDQLLNAEVQLLLDDEIAMGKVVHWVLGPEGIVVSKYDDNPILNSMTYEVEFVDGQVRDYSANVIAETMLSRVDSEGFSTTMMEGIVDN